MPTGAPEAMRRLLDEHPFFSGLDERFLDAIARACTVREFQREEYITREGGVARTFHAILKGSVALEFAGPNGVPVRIQTAGPGEVVGWSALTQPYRYTVDARAAEPTRTLGVDNPALVDALRAHPTAGFQFLMRVFPILSERLHNTMVQLFELHTR